VDLCLALLTQLSTRLARGDVSGLFRRLELAHDLGNRAASHVAPQLVHLRVDHLDRRRVHAREHSRRSRWNRPAEDRERLIRRQGAIDVERAADHRAGTPTDKNTERAAQERRRRLTAHGRPAG
jgi:hypothetical protein